MDAGVGVEVVAVLGSGHGTVGEPDVAGAVDVDADVDQQPVVKRRSDQDGTGTLYHHLNPCFS